jgi:hypothetical protein
MQRERRANEMMRYEYKVLSNWSEAELNRLAKDDFHIREVVQAAYTGHDFLPSRIIMERVVPSEPHRWIIGPANWAGTARLEEDMP